MGSLAALFRKGFGLGHYTTVVVALLLGVIPIVLLGFYAYRVAANTTAELIRKNNEAVLTALKQSVASDLMHKQRMLSGIAKGPDLILIAREKDAEAARSSLKILVESHPDVLRAFVTDTYGTLWSDFPYAPESIGQNFGHRDWYIGLSSNWQPYISRIYRRFAEPQLRLIAFAAPIMDGDEVVGAIVFQMDLGSIGAMLQKVRPVNEGFAFMLDERGIVAAHPHLDVAVAEYDEYVISLANAATQEGEALTYTDPFTGTQMFASMASLDMPGGAWTILSQQPVAEAMIPLRNIALQISIAGIIGAAIMIVLAGSMLRGRAHILELNRQLGAVNRAISSEYGEQRRMFESVLQSFPGMVYVCEKDGRMLFASAKSLELTGYRPEQLIESPDVNFRDLIVPDDRDMALTEIERAIKSGQPYALTYRLRTRDKEEKWVWEQGTPRKDKSGDAVRLEGYVADVSSRISLQRQLEQSQKMEALGRLAGGIAHDFNNLLSVIQGSCSLLLETAQSDDAKRDLDAIVDASARAANLTAQLLAFSRSQVLRPEVLDINDGVRRMIEILQRLIGADIELSLNTREDLPPVRFDPGQIEQIVINLAVNARDAMPTGGQLMIETDEVVFDADYVNSHPGTRVGPHVIIAVSDTGVGMDQATKSRIFEPFFTTKDPGKGTGLGLSTVFGIVSQSGGYIWVYSEPGHGTTFKVYLPAQTIDDEQLSPGVLPAPRSKAGSATLLVVEDDANLRLLITRILSSNGYTVLEAETAEMAMDLCRAHPEIDLLLTDVVMPQLSGPALAAKISEHRPGLRVIFMSGYTDDAVVRHGMLSASSEFLEKPFTPDELLDKVRVVLE